MTCFILAACGGGGGGGGGGDDDSGSGSSAKAPASSSPAAPAEPTAPVSPPPAAGVGSDPSTVSLSWTPPSTRENGEPLSMAEILGYEIYYYAEGDAADDGETIKVNGGSQTSYEVVVPGPGTYHFAMTAVDINGLTSDNSNFVSVTIN